MAEFSVTVSVVIFAVYAVTLVLILRKLRGSDRG